MYVSYGDYDHDNNECWYSIVRNARRSQTGYDMVRNTRITIYGVKKASSVANLTTALTSLESAYQTQNQDLIFKDNDNSTELVHSIRSANTINGIFVVSPVTYALSNIPSGPNWGSGTEYVRSRRFQVTLEYEELVSSAQEIVFWSETLRTIGDGGPEFAVQEAVTGTPQYQNTKQSTMFRVQQTGVAKGLTGYPIAATPIWPSTPPFKRSQSWTVFKTPEIWGRNRNLVYPVEWKYEFHSINALAGSPTTF